MFFHHFVLVKVGTSSIGVNNFVFFFSQTVRFRTKREVEKAHSLYLQSSALDHNKLQEAKSAVNFWVKKNSLKCKFKSSKVTPFLSLSGIMIAIRSMCSLIKN